MATLNNKKIKVLSLDGGGVRGMITIYILKELEEALGKPIQNYFDYIVGTSVGGILAAMLAIKDQNGEFKYDAHYICDLFPEFAKQIFCNDWFGGNWNFFSFGGLFDSKYSRDNLDEALIQKLGNITLGQTKLPIAMHALELHAVRPITFSTFDALKNTANDLKLHDLAGATASAPMYLEPKNVNGSLYVDGGLYANDPAVAGVAELLSHCPTLDEDDLLVVSIGTGISVDGFQFSGNNGGVSWVFSNDNIIDLIFLSTQNFNLYVSEILFKNYVKMQPEIKGALPCLDDSSDENIEHLKQIAKDYAADFLEHNPEFIELISEGGSTDLFELFHASALEAELILAQEAA